MEEATTSGALFRTYNGQLVSTSSVTDEYKTLAKQNNLTYYGGHSLRHTYITNCCNAGIPAQVLVRWVGHTDIGFMIKTYYDLIAEQENMEKYRIEEYIDKCYQATKTTI